EPLDQGTVELDKAKVRIEGAAAFMGPGAGHRWQAADGEKLCGPVARSREAVADPDIAPLGAAIEPREAKDFPLREPGDARRPGRVAGREMRLEPFGIVGVACHIGAVGVAL